MAGYLNLSNTFIYKNEVYIRDNWVEAAGTNFWYKHILSRGARLGLAPVSVITHALDIIIGLGAGVATAATLGMQPQTALFASRHLRGFNFIIANPYKNLLKTLNPTAPLVEAHVGILSHLAKRHLAKLVRDFRRSDHLLVRYVATRLTFALGGLALVITRIMDAILGIIAAPLSFLTLGMVKEINSTAFYGLQATGVINDLFFCMMKVINPWSEVRF